MYLVKTWNWEHISHTMHTILTKRTYYARHLNQGRRLLYSLWTSTLCPSIYLLINSCLTSLLWEVYKCVHLTFTFFFLSVKHHNLILNSLFCCMWTSAAVLMSLMLTCISSPPTPCLFLHIKHKTYTLAWDAVCFCIGTVKAPHYVLVVGYVMGQEC